MFTFQRFVLIFAFLLFQVFNSFACSCKAKPELSILDLNDAEMIFTASIEEYSLGMAIGSLTFKPKEIFKGEVNQTLTIYFKLKDTHTLFHKSIKFREKEDWIVFIQSKSIGNRNYLRLKESENSSYCALSRPLNRKKDTDNYLAYLSKMSNLKDGFCQITSEDSILQAQGFYSNNIPIKLWKYYKPNGHLNLAGMYINGKREGEWLKYTSTSKGDNLVVQKRFYSKGELTEIHDLKYSGAVTFKKFLTDTSEIRHYLFDDGSINTITNRNTENNTMKTASYFKNGALREEKFFNGDKLMYKYVYDENGQKITEWIRGN